MDTIKQQKSLTEQTYSILLDAICSGEMEPGRRLNQDEIAASLSVSRQPVNNAISVLKANGFVQDTGRRGVVVSHISVDQFLSIYEFRSAIEPFAVRLAHERKPPEAATQAADIMKRGFAAAKLDNARAQIDIDFEFHAMLYKWAGNPTIANTMHVNWHHIRRSMGAVVRRGVIAQTSWDEHAQIIEALLNEDVVTAEAAMTHHIESAQNKTLNLIKTNT